ncbi:MAG TPA: IgGFc-binding protein, partial [Minicystis sp.]|nr:IgGFc-binding protein [Minicystis sp.]
NACSADQHDVIDCHGNVVSTCTGDQACDPNTLVCTNACQAAIDAKRSVGCDYYATDMDQIFQDVCFAAIVANTWSTPAHIQVAYQGNALTASTFTRIPSGSGPSLTYAPYDDAMGLPPGQVAVVFLSGSQTSIVPCPVPSAVPTGVMHQTTTMGNSFHITTDVPVVAYQINPYGGGSAQTTGSSLLIPTSAWDKNYVLVNVTPFDIANPSLNIVAAEDDTTITMVPTQAVQGGGGIPAGAANAQMTFMLSKGQNAQISQQAELTGSVLQSDKPVGVMAGQDCMRYPQGNAYCDHGEQMVPPVKALGSEYVAVMYRPRIQSETGAFWKLIGAVDGTQLTYSTPVGGPPTLNAGQVVEFQSGTPFDVKSQDSDHPFLLFTYMPGNQLIPGLDGYGDPDFVLSVPPQQYLQDYVFFADPTYPETSLVVVRAKAKDGTFKDVTLDCAGPLSGWQPVGDYEWTRIDLSTHDFQPVGACSTGGHDIKSDAPFGLWVWGWGTPETSTATRDVSYGYPGGMNVQAINHVVIPPMPK